MTSKVREGLAVAAAEGVDIPAEEADHILQKVMLMLIMKMAMMTRILSLNDNKYEEYGRHSTNMMTTTTSNVH